MGTQRINQLLVLTFGFILSYSVQATVIKNTVPSNPSAQQSPIVKALLQQKRLDKNLVARDDQLRVIISLKNAPTQNSFADQHARFSRLIQSIFKSENS